MSHPCNHKQERTSWDSYASSSNREIEIDCEHWVLLPDKQISILVGFLFLCVDKTTGEVTKKLNKEAESLSY